MRVDKQAEFSNSQAITATALSTNVYNREGPLLSNFGQGGRALYLCVQVDVAFVTGTSLTITVESDSTIGLATSPTVHYSTGAIVTAALIPGMQLLIPLPLGQTFEQYIGLRYTVAGSNYTAGQISAFLTDAPQTWFPVKILT